MKKYEINATAQQLDCLYNAIHCGSPLDIALTYAGISKTTYYFWLATACIAKYCREEQFLVDQLGPGDMLSTIKEKVAEDNEQEKSKLGVGGFVEPSQEQILRYKKNSRYKKYADNCLNIIEHCEKLRTEIIIYHLQNIRDASKQRGRNPLASQWFLERTCPNQFGRKEFGQEDPSRAEVKAIQVKFVDPNNTDSKDRVKAMEDLILNESKADIS